MIDETDSANVNNNLDLLALQLHDIAISRGFWNENGDISFDQLAGKLALVHSEVTEVLEALRKNKGAEAIVEECADILIRVLDLYGALWKSEIVDVSLQDSFNKKVKVNKQRPVLHGHRWG